MPETVTAAAPTVRAVLGRAAAVLAQSGCDTPRLDAELLLGLVLGSDRSGLVLRSREPVDETANAEFDALVARRAAREPVAYITGVKEFRRLTLMVDRRVLIPRPETELLVEVGRLVAAEARVADIGTGSGAVALALKDDRPDLHVIGIDVSAAALEVARANGARLDLEVTWMQGDLMIGDDYDAVLANLPYVGTGCELPPEISRYEPAIALYAGEDGLRALRRLTSMLAGVSVVALEVGVGQAGSVAAMVRAAGFPAVDRLRDLAGHERVVVGRR